MGAVISMIAPDARLLMIVRDPIERYISGMTHLARKKRGPSVAHDAGQTHVSSYGRLLRTVEQHVSRKQLLVLQYEKCVNDAEGELNRTFDFLGLDPFCPPNIQVPVNETPTPKLSMSDQRRRQLVRSFVPDVDDLIGRYPHIDRGLWPNFR
jgi:hypothetical protein